MTDSIAGTVTRIIDGLTFEIAIDFRHEDNTDVYLDLEIIRLANFHLSALGHYGDNPGVLELRRKLWNRNISLRIIGRDEADRVVGYVTNINY